MIELNERAQKHLDQYLQQIRTCLKDCPAVDADEVEQNVKEHIENELNEVSEPVTFDDLDAVLKKLGSPEKWIPEEEISWWRKIALRLRCGPEDWRLAYLSFGLLILSLPLKGFLPLLAVLLLPIIFIGGNLTISIIFISKGISGVGLLLASFYVARVVLAITDDKEELGEQKWLIYPSLIVVYIPLIILILFAPITVIPGGVRGDIIFTSLWWIVLGIVLSIWPKIVHAVFRPFGNWWTRKHGIILILIGLPLPILLTLIFRMFFSLLR
jgi:hypothetical protein